MTAAEIKLTGVARRYEKTHVLQDVTLTAPAGGVLALLGQSGSGKSTILRLIAGLEPIDAGEIRIDSEIASTPSRTTPPEARRIGIVFQDYALFPHLTALANVGFGLDRIARAEREAVSRRWLDRVGLAKRAHAFPHELSGGEQQRVALARALAPGPRAVLLDEPFSGLDPTLRGELREAMLGALQEARATAVFVTHHADEALFVADRLAILKDGRVLQESAARDAYDKPASAEAAAALGPVNVYDAIVRAGVAHTPFLDAPAPNFADKTSVRVVVRAEAIRLAEGSRARVIERRPQGPFDLVVLEANGALCRALVAPRSASGETADIAADPAGLFVFRA